ncbi:MAG: MBL fold metallo-hydrolase [Promethearchaeia archaeon]
MDAEILNLFSNVAMPRSDLSGSHGQSFLIQIGEENILFDTGGSGDVLLENMEKLKVEPNEITKLVISHGHYDHTKGLPAFLDARNPNGPLEAYAHPNIQEEKVAKIFFFKKDIGFPDLTPQQEKKIKFNYRRKPVTITKGLRTTGEIRDRPYRDGREPRALHKEEGKYIVDPVYDDISLILQAADGQVIITGCAHAGILNVCKHAKQTSDKPIKAIIGGTHMARYSKEEVLETAEIFINEFDNPTLYLNHCTDQLPYKIMKSTPAIDILQTQYGKEKIKPCFVGTKITYKL